MFMTAPLFIGWWIAGARYLMARDRTIDAKWRRVYAYRDAIANRAEFPPKQPD